MSDQHLWISTSARCLTMLGLAQQAGAVEQATGLQRARDHGLLLLAAVDHLGHHRVAASVVQRELHPAGTKIVLVILDWTGQLV